MTRYIDTEVGMRQRIDETRDLHRRIFEDGVVAGIKIGLVAGILLTLLLVWGASWR